MSRIVIIITVLSSFTVTPILCIGGVIDHDCGCASESGCPCETDCKHEDGGGHEGGCPDDPCSVLVVRPDRDGDDVLMDFQQIGSTAIVLADFDPPSPLMARASTRSWSGCENLPFSGSDLPLLI